MAIDYDEFRSTTWEERVAIFSALTPEGKAELFRSQVSGWLERHRDELTDEQIEFLGEAARAATPEVYSSRSPEVLGRVDAIDKRAKQLLSREQWIDALTMQWGMT